jgi:hypothetical protein
LIEDVTAQRRRSRNEAEAPRIAGRRMPTNYCRWQAMQEKAVVTMIRLSPRLVASAGALKAATLSGASRMRSSRTWRYCHCE